MRWYDFTRVPEGSWYGEVVQLLYDTRSDEGFVGRALYMVLLRELTMLGPGASAIRDRQLELYGTHLVYVPNLGEMELRLAMPPPPMPRVRLDEVRTRRFDIIDRSFVRASFNIADVVPPPVPPPVPRSVWERLDDDYVGD